MSTSTFQPSVDAVQEFIEIANDFANPLDLVREAISNAFDANAKTMSVIFDVIKEMGDAVLVITLQDDGTGMNDTTINSFFDLGNSTRRGDTTTIGEKGHGTKVYFNSASVQVITTSEGHRITATMDEPYKRLFNHELPTVTLETEANDGPTGTTVTIKGYNHNRRELFTHERLKDHVLWFTKLGSVEQQFDIHLHDGFRLFIKGLDNKTPEEIHFGHYFPPESESVQKLFDKHLIDAPKFFSKCIVKRTKLRQHPEIAVDAVFSVEGNKIKQSYNPMLRRQGFQAPEGSYTVQERYGVWLCKDYIPIQQVNEWVSVKGTEYTRLHAFVNCQELRLTANRGSVMNTPAEILADLRGVVQEIYGSVTAGQEWIDMDWLLEESEGFRNTEREKNDFTNRLQRFNRANVATYKNSELVEPAHESGVFGLVLKLSTIQPSIFPFHVLDYNTHTGIDLLVKGDHNTPLAKARLHYVELKYILGKESLNHSFENLSTIVCWDTKLKHDDVITDLNGQQRRMRIESPSGGDDYTMYFLDSAKKAIKIEVVVLKYYLRERCGIEFTPRVSSAIV